jgi:hypothetical protein
MKISFACPSCAAVGSADGSAVGKTARCRQCGHRFIISDPSAAEPEIYSLEEPAEGTTGMPAAIKGPAAGPAFATAREDGPTAPSPRKSTRSATRMAARSDRMRGPRSASRIWPTLTWAGFAAVIAIAAIAAFAPSGMLIAACTVMALGGLMILVGYGVGAYGAFREDFLYGFLYIVIPLYTAYYMVTRWDDLWIWFACMSMGVGLMLLGIEMARWGGVGA